MNARINTILRWQEYLFLFFAAITMVGFPFSEALVSISAGFLLVLALVFYFLSPHVPSSKSRFLMYGFGAIFIVYLIWSLFTNDWQMAIYELNKVLFWIIFPLGLYLSPPLSKTKTYLLLLLFVAAVVVSSLIFTVKLFLADNNEALTIRSLGFVSNIRFSFQVVLSVILMVWFLIFSGFDVIRKFKWVSILTIVWLVWFLFILKSLIGLIAFFGTVTVSAFIYLLRVKNIPLRYGLLTLFLLAAATPVVYVASVAHQFYAYTEVDRDSVEWITPSGNYYHHDFEQTVRENGHLVFLYISEDELRRSWNKVGNLDYDSELNGYPLGTTLIRYLTSMGLRKDSVGIAQLTPDDIEHIERGVTNFRFKNRTFSIYPRVYDTLWELEQYRSTGDPNNKSLVQRIEFLKASWILVKQNPWLGVGTGNWVKAYNSVYENSGSRLTPENRRSSHNQYLNYIVKFGFVGFIFILAALLFVIVRGRYYRNFILLHFLIAMAIANLGDANLETHMGLSFFVFFFSFIAWYMPNCNQKRIG